MKIPTLKAVYEYALQKTSEDIALKRPDDAEGYDQKLDQLYQDDEDENKTTQDLMIRRIA